MRGSEGYQKSSKKPAVTLMCFGRTEHDLRDTLLDSLQAFSDSLQDDFPVRPVYSCRYESDPAVIPPVNQAEAYYPLLERAGGNIVLGVTATGFYDPGLSRFIFGYGSFNGRGLLSTYRFRTETPGRRLFLERMGKQIIKTLSMACNMSNCNDQECVISRHRYVSDLDRNRYVCGPCRDELVRGILFYLGNDGHADDPVTRTGI
jgi:predicted Zn-dependent protease